MPGWFLSGNGVALTVPAVSSCPSGICFSLTNERPWHEENAVFTDQWKALAVFLWYSATCLIPPGPHQANFYIKKQQKEKKKRKETSTKIKDHNGRRNINCWNTLEIKYTSPTAPSATDNFPLVTGSCLCSCFALINCNYRKIICYTCISVARHYKTSERDGTKNSSLCVCLDAQTYKRMVWRTSSCCNQVFYIFRYRKRNNNAVVQVWNVFYICCMHIRLCLLSLHPWFPFHGSPNPSRLPSSDQIPVGWR